MSLHNLAHRIVRAVPFSLRSRIKSVPIVGPVQRWFVSSHLSGEPFVHEVDAGPSRGIRYEITLPEDKGIWTGAYETDFSQYVAKSVEPGCVGYDVGAWHGFFSGVMLAQGAREVVMFEPLPANIAKLERVIALNSNHSLSLQTVALGDKRGTGRFIQVGDTSMAKLDVSPFQAGRTAVDSIDVGVESLDELVESACLPKPDIMKIDIEGAEMMMLEGAQETLAQAKPTILAEIHSGELLKSVRTLLMRHGYVVEELATGDTALRGAEAVQIRARPLTN